MVEDFYEEYLKKHGLDGILKMEAERERKILLSLNAKPELGRDYGLVFINSYNKEICTSLDGKTTTVIAGKGSYHRLFLEETDLYYTQSNSLYQWPNKLIKNFGTRAGGITSQAWGITRYQDKLVVALIDQGKIVDENGTELFSGLTKPVELAVFRDEWYHTENYGRGLVKTPHQSIKKTGDWTSGLTILNDKLYFGGHDQTIYSYDGNQVEEVCQTDFGIWTLHGVGNTLYAGGSFKKGILTVDLKNNQQQTILEDSVYQVGSIVSAPLSVIEKLNRGK